jgi:glycosyltransferase involved in cell wall biosynthesis
MNVAVILTHNRPELLRDTVTAVGPQVDMVIVIDNASDPPVPYVQLDHDDDDHLGLGEAGRGRIAVTRVPDQPPNLFRMWNRGIALAEHICPEESRASLRIAILCDDAPPPEGWFAAVAAAMAETGAVIGCSAPPGFGWAGPPRVKTQHDGDIVGRMPGWAFILDPNRGIRADEQFEWWWGDTDLDLRARVAGGMVMIGTHPVHNVHPNEFSARPAQAAQIGTDSQRFSDKYNGWRPW